MKKDYVKLVECPRDAMQGWKNFIPTDKKIAYINSLLEVGFDTIDFGSFVSARTIPQMADTAEVVAALDINPGNTRLLAIVANQRGAEEACRFDKITFLGFPFSISETFQQRNTHSGIMESLKRVETIRQICIDSGKELVVYISMAFGNPYGDEYSEDIVYHWASRLTGLGINIISLADTVGLATPDQVFNITKTLIDALPHTEIGVHLHALPDNWLQKSAAALKAGCHRFDGALKGIGGCPMAGDELVGNMNTEWMIESFEKQQLLGDLNKKALARSLALAAEIFI